MDPKHQKQSDAPAKNDDSEGERPEEFGGSSKPEPTRYGDWEVNGRCSDF
jgi:hypothetical protein